jgi:hypothetical protein
MYHIVGKTINFYSFGVGVGVMAKGKTIQFLT